MGSRADAAMLKAQSERNRRAVEERETRILKVAKAEPDLRVVDLAERFHVSPYAMRALLIRHGVALIRGKGTRENGGLGGRVDALAIKAPKSLSWFATQKRRKSSVGE